jgi:RNA polymerase sigma factor (sigma-70 family)
MSSMTMPCFERPSGESSRQSVIRFLLYESATQFLMQLRHEEQPSCILLDVSMPNLSGPALQDRLAKDAPFIPIVFLSGHGDIPTSVKAIKSGAEDFLTKPVSREDLVEAIERALARAGARLEQHHRLGKLHELLSSLTKREREVFELVVRGKMNKQIAFELGTTERTIKAHRQRVMEKLKATSIAELVSTAERLGILDSMENTIGTKNATAGRELPTSARTKGSGNRFT